MTIKKIIRAPLKSELGLFLLFTLVLAALLAYPSGLGQVDRLIYDNLTKASHRPASDQIVIIAIDEISIASLGRWPWPRSVHSHLLNRLANADVKAIGMDIIFSEPETTKENDAQLASSIVKSGHTVLPVLIEQTINGFKTTLPLPELETAANRLGHIHFTFDTDGVVRRIDPQKNLNGVVWPQFSFAVYHSSLEDGNKQSGRLHTAGKTTSESDELNKSYLTENVDNKESVLIPFTGTLGQFNTISYIDVLSGRIPLTLFKKKYVLIGATAAGIASIFATPVTNSYSAMPGVEINANILAGLIEKRSIHHAAGWIVMLFTMLVTLSALTICRNYSPLRSLGMIAALVAAISLFDYCLFLTGIWLPPAAAILMVLAIYPLWSWRKLEATNKYIYEEIARLNLETSMVWRHAKETTTPNTSDFLDKRLSALRIAANRSHDMRQFVIDNLNSMPDAALVLSPSGELLIANRLAREYFASIGLEASKMPTLDTIFANFSPYFETNAKRLSWRDALMQSTAQHTPVEIETRDVNQREFLIKSAPSRKADNSILGWIVSLVDVTNLRAVERRREESLNFISHDMRVPQSSILALIQLQKNSATAFPLLDFLSRIERSVETTLNLADNFVHLAKAESQPYQLQETDFSSMLADAADDMWALAHSKSIKIVVNTATEACWLNVDRSLLVRAIGNLLSNAIKFSPPGSQVNCSAQAIQTESHVYIRCSIADQGKGIAVSNKNVIFSPFLRANESGRDGIGLGLAFVKMVIDRHGGTIDIDSIVGKGSIFTLTLPCVIDRNEY